MRKAWVVGLVVILLGGCCCRRCYGQELEEVGEVKPEVAMVTVSSTEVVEWKQIIYKGLSTLTRDPFSAVCDILLIHAFGMSRLPTDGQPAELPAEGKARMDKIANSINASLGFAIVSQYQPPEENHAAIDAAISAATETIKDANTRAIWLKKAQLLRGE